jgi:LacI family transcriptional regulator
MGFRSLRERGFRRFGFWGVPGYWTSDQRQRGFEASVAASGCVLHPGTRPPLGSFAAIMAAGSAWLASAPKPLAVFTDTSLRAVEMLWAARLAGLAIPEQVAVLAGAEDPVHCTLNAPHISAVDDDGRGLGRTAATLLEAVLRQRPVAPAWRCLPPRAVISRASTDTFAEVPDSVARGLACIRDRAHLGIGVPGVVRAAGAARRTLELAFRVSLDRSIHEQIALTRVERIRELLETTSLGLREIAQRAGLGGDASLLNRLFTRHVGLGPRAYRQRYAAPPP